jgi:hypothetical protein
VRSQDERSGSHTMLGNRFEKPLHHRNQIYSSSKLEKDQSHARKPASKNNSSAARLSMSKLPPMAYAQDYSHSPRQSIASIAKQQQNTTVRSISPCSDAAESGLQMKQRDRSSISSNQLSDDTCKYFDQYLIESCLYAHYCTVCILLVNDTIHPVPPVTIHIVDEGRLYKFILINVLECVLFLIHADDAPSMDGATAAERIYPWRRSSLSEDTRSTSNSPVNDPFTSPAQASSKNDHQLHSAPLTSADFSGTYHKSPEYLGEYATTTKTEEHTSRPHVRDLFVEPSLSSNEDTENEGDAAATIRL